MACGSVLVILLSGMMGSVAVWASLVLQAVAGPVDILQCHFTYL